MRTLVEAQGAGQGVLDEVFRCLCLGDPAFEHGDVSVEQAGVIHRVVRGQQFGQLTQAQAGFLAHENHGDARQIGRTVAALPARVAGRSQQPHGFPMPQHMGGQAEAAGQLADGEVHVRGA